MKKELSMLLEEFKANPKIPYYDVARRKQAIVLRILDNLGWDTFDVEEVYPDYPVSKGVVDFALRNDNHNKAFILVVGPDEVMYEYEMGLIEVSKEASAEIAVLTNGIEWWFYLPLKDNKEGNCKFHNLQIYKQQSIDLSKKFIIFLSKDWVLKGKSADSAYKVFRSRKKKRLIRESLMDIWNEYTKNTENELVWLLAKESEKVSGYPPDPEDVVGFLRSVMKKGRKKKVLVRSSVEEKIAKVVKSRPDKVTSNVKPKKKKGTIALSSRSGAYIGKKPEAFIFLNRRHKVKKWKEVLIKVCNILSRVQESDFEKVLSLAGRKRKYFSKNVGDLKEPRMVNGTDIYVETNFNASNLYMIAVKVLRVFGYSEDDLEIETKK